MIAQKLYNNFKQFRIYDLSDHKVNHAHLLVRGGRGAGGWRVHECVYACVCACVCDFMHACVRVGWGGVG